MIRHIHNEDMHYLEIEGSCIPLQNIIYCCSSSFFCLELPIYSYRNSGMEASSDQIMSHQPFLMSTKNQKGKQSDFGDSNDSESEKQINMKQSNYKMFSERWQKKSKYLLPGSFKLIQINDCCQQKITSQFEWFNFSILSYSCQQLCEVAVKIIKSTGFQAICSTDKIQKIVKQICLGYNAVSYHNFSHAFSLMHMLFQLIKLDFNFKKMYTTQEIGFCLIAALTHDINHPGTNNAYQIKLKSQLASQSSNESVLEKMHVKQFFQILKQKNIDIFQKSSNPQKMKQLIIQAILSTDVSKHFANLQHLKKLLAGKKQVLKQIPEEEERYFYMQQVFHACDIGNPCLEFQEYINWAALLTYQFNTQTLMEAENSLQITQMLRYKSLKGFYQGQIGFINYLVYPLWKQLSNHWTGFSLLMENIDTNLKLLQIKAQNQRND